jgi:hypothetical protein
VANRVIFMDQGQIVEQNAPEPFFNNPQSERTKLFLSQILGHCGVEDTRHAGPRLHRPQGARQDHLTRPVSRPGKPPPQRRGRPAPPVVERPVEVGLPRCAPVGLGVAGQDQGQRHAKYLM